jgi:hypothetical protein
MSDKIALKSFPQTQCEALAMLYLKSQDLTPFTPEQIYDKYKDAYEKIEKHHKALLPKWEI